MKNKYLRSASIVLAILMIAAALYLLLMPKVNEIILEKHAEEQINEFYTKYWRVTTQNPSDHDYQSKPDNLSPQQNPCGYALYPELYLDMQRYNEEIFENGQKGISDPWAYQVSAMDLSKYGLDDSPIGVLSIPKMNFQQPIFVGATSQHLEDGVAQLAISSMPIGGTNTNCVIAGHRGWRSAPYMRYIDVLEPGDIISVTNFWEVLIYKVVEIRIINPHEAENILIQPGKDLVTLLTCHPYGSGGKQRILVFCERVQN